jgi:hypothetical protein
LLFIQAVRQHGREGREREMKVIRFFVEGENPSECARSFFIPTTWSTREQDTLGF